MKLTMATWQDYGDLMALRRQQGEHEMNCEPTLRPGNEAVGEFDRSLQTAGWLRDKDCLVILAWDGADAVGFIAINAGCILGLGRELTTKIDGFYVRPDARPEGVAGKLYRAAIKVGKGLAAMHQADVWTQALVVCGNVTMSRHMEGLGFEPIATLYQRRIAHGR